jgi:hypothetical protein
MEKRIASGNAPIDPAKYKCRITVLRKSFNQDLFELYPYGDASP